MIHRIQSPVLLIVFAALVACGATTPVAARQAASDDRGDLVAALPRPADLEAVGLDGFVSGVGATGGSGTLDRFDEVYRGAGVVPVLDREGMARGSSLVLVRAADLDRLSPDRVIATVSQFDAVGDAGTAAQGLIDARADLDGADVVPGEGSRTGDGSAPTAVFVPGNDPLGSPDYRQVSAIGLVDTAVVEIAVGFTGETDPSVEVATDLYSVVADRLSADRQDAITPGSLIPEIMGDDIDPDVSRYVIADGRPVPVAGRESELERAQAERFAAYASDSVVEYAYQGVDGTISIGGYISAHATTGDAADYLTAVPGILRSDETLDDVRTSNVIVRVGDGATLLTYTRAEDGLVVTELVFRVDQMVVELIVSARDDVPAGEMTALADVIVACATDGVCDPVIVPDDLDFPGA